MTLTDIKLVEKDLNIVLPEELVEKYTSNLLAGIEDYPELAELFFMEPIVLVRLNKRLREKGLFKMKFPEYL